MKEEKRIKNSKACYRPAEVLTNYLKEALRLEDEAEKMQKEIGAGGTSTAQQSIIKPQEEAWKMDKKNLNKRKVGLLDDCIFPSMANLTILLEAMAESPFIEHIFAEDFKSLFFAKSKAISVKSKVPEERYKASRSIFTRFVNACCKLTIGKSDNAGRRGYVPLDESRVILCDMMLESVYNALSEIEVIGIGRFDFPSDITFLRRTLYPDLDRIRAWTQLFAWEASKELIVDEDGRPALF